MKSADHGRRPGSSSLVKGSRSFRQPIAYSGTHARDQELVVEHHWPPFGVRVDLNMLLIQGRATAVDTLTVLSIWFCRFHRMLWRYLAVTCARVIPLLQGCINSFWCTFVYDLAILNPSSQKMSDNLAVASTPQSPSDHESDCSLWICRRS